MTLLGGEAYVTFKPDLVDADGNIGERARGNFCKGFSTSSLRCSCESPSGHRVLQDYIQCEQSNQ